MPLPTKVNVTRPRAFGYDALLEYGDTDAESLYLRLAAGPNRRLEQVTAEVEDRAPQLEENPEDIRPELGRVYSRSDFSGGEGLDRAHRRGSTDRDFSRYWDSLNVDVSPPRPGEPAVLKLLHDTSLLRASVNFNPHLARIGTTLYLANGTMVDRSANPTATTPTWTSEDPSAGEPDSSVRGLAVLGNELYAFMQSGGIHKRGSDGTWAHWSDLSWASAPWNALKSVKGRILVLNNNNLYEAGPGATSILLHTLPSGNSWIDAVDAGAVILAAASDGYVYAFTEENGELVLKGQTLIEGEEPSALGAAQGLVFVGTNQPNTAGGSVGRLWAFVLSGVRLTAGQVLREWREPDLPWSSYPRWIAATRDSVYTAVQINGEETHLWRVHLATSAVSHDLIILDFSGGRSYGFAIVDNRIFVTVAFSGLWRENTTYASSGWLIGAPADFFTSAPKAWVGARLSCQDLAPEEQAVLAYSTKPEAITDVNDPSWTDAVAVTSANGLNEVEVQLVDVESRYIAPKVTLTPNTARTSTPKVLSYALRGLPMPSDTVWRVPVNVSDQLELPHRKRLRVPGSGEAVLDKLRELEGEYVTVTLLRQSEKLAGQLVSVTAPIDEIPERGSPSAYALLEIRGVRSAV